MSVGMLTELNLSIMSDLLCLLMRSCSLVYCRLALSAALQQWAAARWPAVLQETEVPCVPQRGFDKAFASVCHFTHNVSSSNAAGL